jgi:hypothetical protein
LVYEALPAFTSTPSIVRGKDEVRDVARKQGVIRCGRFGIENVDARATNRAAFECGRQRFGFDDGASRSVYQD